MNVRPTNDLPIIRFAIITVSDRCSSGECKDLSGLSLRTSLNKYAIQFIGVDAEYDVVPDDVSAIQAKLVQYCSSESLIDVILTVGGTGFAPRDVTPEATIKVVDRLCPAITTAMTAESLKITKMAMLSRSVAGIRNKTLIVNLPGSEKGCQQCLDVIAPCLPHAVKLLRQPLTTTSDTSGLSVSAHVDTNVLPISKVKIKPSERARVSAWPMVDMNSATNLVMDSSKRNLPIVVPLLDAIGQVTCEDIYAQEALPPFRASIKDGYAIREWSPTGIYTVIGSFVAGSDPANVNLQGNSCMRVSTGSPVPVTAIAVIQVEDTKLVSADEEGNELSIEITLDKCPPSGTDIREIGSDIALGELVLPAGSILSSAEVGLVAAVGITCVTVFRKPKVAVLSTGNELTPPGQPLPDGSVRDSNMPTLLTLLKENGFKSCSMGIARDTPEELYRALVRCLNTADVIVTTGSVSMGERDYLKAMLVEDLGAKIHFGRVNMKPGKPTTFATLDYPNQGCKKYIFCLPGNPVSATVMCHLMVIPLLKRLSGYDNPFATSINAIVDFDIELDTRPEYRRAILKWGYPDGLPRALSTGTQLSSRLLSWRDANCLLLIPSKTEQKYRVSTGEVVEALLVRKI